MDKNSEKPLGLFGRISRFFKRETTPEPSMPEHVAPEQSTSSSPVVEAPVPEPEPETPEPAAPLIQTDIKPGPEPVVLTEPEPRVEPVEPEPAAPVQPEPAESNPKSPFGNLVWNVNFELPASLQTIDFNDPAQKRRLHVADMSREEVTELVTTYVLSQISSENLGVEVMAQHLKVSRTSLYQMVHEAFGVTPANYILYCRLNYALSLLNKGHKVREVSSRCGFSDPKYFSKVFRKYLGVLPSNYTASTSISPDSQS